MCPPTASPVSMKVAGTASAIFQSNNSLKNSLVLERSRQPISKWQIVFGTIAPFVDGILSPMRGVPANSAPVKMPRYNRSSMIRRVYLDNNATTAVLPEVMEAMRPYFEEHFGNASSIHHHGQETRAAVERARESVAALLGCRASEVVFTSGGTEADNLAIFGLTKFGSGSSDHVIISTIEHHAVLNACKHLAAQGCEVTYIPVDG